MADIDSFTEQISEPGNIKVAKIEADAKSDIDKNDHTELKPLSMETLDSAVQADFDLIKELSEAHSVLASRWDVLAKWARLVVALTAALSAVSLVGDNDEITNIFSILTALIAAMNAAFNPPETSAKHRLSAKEFLLLSRKLELLWRRIEPYRWTATPCYDDVDLKVLYDRYLELRADVEQAIERAPAINRLRKQTNIKRDALSWWDFWRITRMQKRQAKLEKFNMEQELEMEKAEKAYRSQMAELRQQ